MEMPEGIKVGRKKEIGPRLLEKQYVFSNIEMLKVRKKTVFFSLSASNKR